MKRIIALAAALLIFRVGLRAECVTFTIGPNGKPIIAVPPPPSRPPPPVIHVSGAFCGTAFGTASTANDPIVTVLDNAEVDLIDDLGHVVARGPTDGSGKFTFPALPVGKYRATLGGFMSTEEVIEIRDANQVKCELPLFVTLIVSGECSPRSHISTVAPTVEKR